MPAARRSSNHSIRASPERMRSPPRLRISNLAPPPGIQPSDPLQGLQIVIKGRADKDPDLEIIAVGRLFPIVETMNELLEEGEGERAALARLRDQAIPADMSAWSVAQRKPQSLPDDFSRHCDLAARCSDEAHHRVGHIAGW